MQGLEKIKSAPRIRELNIVEQRLHQMPVEIRRIRNCLRSIAEKHSKKDILDKVRVVMNREQFREFKVLKGIEKIIEIIVLPKKKD